SRLLAASSTCFCRFRSCRFLNWASLGGDGYFSACRSLPVRLSISLSGCERERATVYKQPAVPRSPDTLNAKASKAQRPCLSKAINLYCPDGFQIVLSSARGAAKRCTELQS